MVSNYSLNYCSLSFLGYIFSVHQLKQKVERIHLYNEDIYSWHHSVIFSYVPLYEMLTIVKALSSKETKNIKMNKTCFSLKCLFVLDLINSALCLHFSSFLPTQPFLTRFVSFCGSVGFFRVSWLFLLSTQSYISKKTNLVLHQHFQKRESHISISSAGPASAFPSQPLKHCFFSFLSLAFHWPIAPCLPPQQVTGHIFHSLPFNSFLCCALTKGCHSSL